MTQTLGRAKLSIPHVLEFGYFLSKLISVVLVLIRNGDLASSVFRECCFVFLSDPFLVYHLWKPVDLVLMLNEVDALI